MARPVKLNNKSKNRSVNFRIQLTPAAKAQLVKISKHTAITQLSLCSKLVEWFALQPKLLQNEVLGLYPQTLKKDISQLIRKRLRE